MLPDPDEQTARLRQLHDDYAWKVNAAVAEGRDDLIRRLSDEYVEEAVGLIADGCPPCTCEICRSGQPPRPATPPRRRWFAAFRSPRTRHR
jgi:hypothetical protein